MDIRKLATFVDLAQTLSYTETAGRLYVTQATVSKQIKALEQELDVTLFDRTHRTVTLTADGRFTLAYAQKIVATATAYHQALVQRHQAADRRLVVRAVPSISQYQAFNLLAAFTKQYPDIDLQFAEAETDLLLPALDSKAVDVVFTRLFATPSEAYDVLIGGRDQLVALVPATHPLARQKQVAVSMLAGESLLLLRESTGLYQPVIALLRQAKVTPKIAYQGNRIDLVAGMVNRGMGVAIMMQHSVPLAPYPNMVALPLVPTVASQLAFVRVHGHHNPAAAAFWAFLQAHV